MKAEEMNCVKKWKAIFNMDKHEGICYSPEVLQEMLDDFKVGMEEYASLKQDEFIEKIWDKIRVSEGVINENDTTTRLEYESYGKNSLGFREFLKSFK